MSSPSVAAVVVNVDGGSMLDACLDALASQAPAALIVVDNGSSEAERARLSARRDVHVLLLGENRGFAGPANRGVEAAARLLPAISFVAVVNNDCTLEPGYLAACASVLETDPEIAAVQGVILDGGGERVDGCGIAWNQRAEAVQLRRSEAPPPREAAPFAVPGVSATAGVYRMDAFRTVGGFEESFFAYYEDADLSLRLSRAGGRFLCVPAARARHLGSATGGRRPAMKWRRLFENRLRTLRRNVAPGSRAPIGLRGAFAGLRDAAAELGLPRAAWAALGAAVTAGGERRRDLQVLAALPPLTKLPR